MTASVPVLDGRVAVIGDIGGHLDALLGELIRLGVPDGGRGRIPSGLTIVQVGDLVHRGPDSAGVVALVDRHLRRSPDRWIQLVGNHEAFYLRRRQFSWAERLPRASVEVIRDWWHRGMMRVAVGIVGHRESFLVTHAGVTRAFWSTFLDATGDPVRAALALNAMPTTRARALFRAGVMMAWRRPDPLAGPIWAAAGQEVAASWAEHRLPFSQVYGHSHSYDWDTKRWWVEEPLRSSVIRDPLAKHTVMPLPGGRLIGVDPGNMALAAGEFRALVITR